MKYLIVIFSISLCPMLLLGQANDLPINKFKIEGGSDFKGYIIEEDSNTILVKLNQIQDTILLEKALIKKIFRGNSFKVKYVGQENLGWSKTAFNMHKGEKRFSNISLFYNEYAQGINDNLSFSATTIIDPYEILYGEIYFHAVASVKYTYQWNENVHLGLTPGFVYDSDTGNLGFMTTATITVGDQGKFFNFSYQTGIDFDDGLSIISIGGGVDLSDNLAFVTDNLILMNKYGPYDLIYHNGDDPIYHSMGLKLFKNKHMFQLGYYLGLEDFNVLPIMSYAYHWGR